MTPLTRIRTSLLSTILPGDPLGGLKGHITDVEVDIATRDEFEYRRSRDMLLGYLNCLVALGAVDYGDRTELIDALDAKWKEDNTHD